MITRARLSAAAAAAAIALAGCGSDADQIRSAIHNYLGGFVDGDGTRACDQLSTATRQSFQRDIGGRDCATALSQDSRLPALSRLKAALKNAKVTTVKVKGSTATASLEVMGAATPVSLIKQGGSWKIQSPPGG